MDSLISTAIRKAKQVKGKTLTFRDANVADARFILSLRTDEKKSRYLSSVSNDLGAQEAWLESYETKTDQAYFIIEYQDQSIGTVRLYDAKKDSFCWGSWILKEGRPSTAAMESALMVYSYAVNDLGFNSAHFDVRIGNDRVWKFHERFGASRLSASEEDYFYMLSNESIKAALATYSKFLPYDVKVSR